MKTTFNFKNIFSQNTPPVIYVIGMIGIVCATIGTATATVLSSTPNAFGTATHTVQAIAIGIGAAGGIIKLVTSAIGGNLNPNNITAETATATQDASKPTK